MGPVGPVPTGGMGPGQIGVQGAGPGPGQIGGQGAGPGPGQMGGQGLGPGPGQTGWQEGGQEHEQRLPVPWEHMESQRVRLLSEGR